MTVIPCEDSHDRILAILSAQLGDFVYMFFYTRFINKHYKVIFEQDNHFQAALKETENKQKITKPWIKHHELPPHPFYRIIHYFCHVLNKTLITTFRLYFSILVQFLMTFYMHKNSKRISCEIIFVNGRWHVPILLEFASSRCTFIRQSHILGPFRQVGINFGFRYGKARGDRLLHLRGI